MRLKSIGARLTFWYTGILSLTLLLLGTIAYGLLTFSLSHEIDTALKGLGQVIADREPEKGRTHLPPNLDELFQRFFGFSPSNRYFEMVNPSNLDELFQRFFGFSPSNRCFEMVNPQGRPKSNTPPSCQKLIISPKALNDALHGITTFETLKTIDPYPVRVMVMPVIEGDHLTNLVQVGISLENMYKTRRKFVWIMATILPFGLLLAGGGGWLLARRALRPVDNMTQDARRISVEHLQERLHENWHRR